MSNASEHRTPVLARQGMMSWAQPQLEPSKLRAPDSFTAPHSLTQTASLYRPCSIMWRKPQSRRIANRLALLIDDVGSISVEVDARRLGFDEE